jgi:DNA repair exonuclease SbcCD nuclease subunit
MIITHAGRTIEFLGDAHLGKPFIHGVPLHRRGDREKVVWADFERSVLATSADFHINLGDLLDRPVVPYDVIVRAARIYVRAAEHHPETQFLILQGNHDVSRDLERVSAFDVFAEIVWGIGTIRVVREPIVVDGLLLVPFDPVAPTAELIAELKPSAEIAIGHWDVESFGGDDHNLIPTKLLAELGVKRVYTGHVHKPDRFTRDGIDVVVVGSLQPFSHGEGDMYITLSLDEAREVDPAAIKDRCIRIQLKQGETYDLEIDCLQLTLQRLGGEEEPETVTLGDFDMAALFSQAFDQAGVSADLRATVVGKHDELREAAC